MENLLEWAKKLNESGKLVIVEGVKDRKALEAIGITNVMTLKKPIYAVSEQAVEKSKDIIILTDFDKKGKELYGRLKKDLIKNGAKIDHTFREFLLKNTKLSHIEGINTYIRNLEK